MMIKRIKSNQTLITQIVPICLALWVPFAQAGEIIIDVTGMDLTGGSITGGTICKDNKGDCIAILKYEGADKTIQTVLLKGGEVKFGTPVGGKISDGKISDYGKIKIEKGIITGSGLTGARLTGAKISNVEISNAIVSDIDAGLQTQPSIKNFNKNLNATLTSDDISAATIEGVTIKDSATKTENTAATATIQDIPNDKSSWKGDRVKILSDFYKIKDPLNPDNPYFAPNGATLDVVTDVSQGDSKGSILTVKFRRDGLDGDQACATTGMFKCSFLEQPQKRLVSSKAIPQNKLVSENDVYQIDKADLENGPHIRQGWSFGALIVPFKYQLSDRSFGNNTTIGPYVGYKFQDSRGSVTPVISAGWVSNIAVPLANGGGSVNRSGFSGAIGVIFSIDKGTGIQMGVLLGQDRLGSSAAAPYAYEGKTWLSLSIGFKFI